ncbi:MAG: S8 family serine peptidase [Microbacterium sp.]
MKPRLALLAAALIVLVVAPPAHAEDETPTPTPTPTEDPVRAAEYWLDDYGITDAWKTTKGKGVTVAVIDTGIADGPEEFDGAVVGGADVSGAGTEDGRTPVGAQDRDHGSYVASLLAGRGTGDDTGMIGVAPEANLLSISIGFGSSSSVPFTDQLASAMKQAVDLGADIINLSLTTNSLGWDESWDDAFLYAFDHDVLVVAAAGNRGSGTEVVGAPATIPGVLVVGGVDEKGVASVNASTQGITIGVMAPSEQLLGVSIDGDTKTWNGTSGAAPIVSGIAALIKSAHPELSAADIIARIEGTAAQSEKATSTPDPIYGYGLIDAAAAVEDDGPTATDDPADELRDWIAVHRRADDDDPEPTQTSAPVSIPPIPPAEAPGEAGSPLAPSSESLREVTIPLVAASAAGILIVLGAAAVFRRVRATRARR